MSLSPADPLYRRDLGNGLIQRWSTTADTESIAELMGRVWRYNADEPSNPRIIDYVRRIMRDDFPLMQPGDFAVVEDSRRPAQPIVACACLWHHQWTYEGIPFDVGQPEDIATDPDYRNRGLVRALIEMVHTRSAASGHLIQIINGIPYFYRQFGYEYALDMNGKRITYLSLIPPKLDQSPEPCTLRAATSEDIPQLMDLYAQRCRANMVSVTVPAGYWRYVIERWNRDEADGVDPALSGIQTRPLMIIDGTGAVCGYAVVATKRWDRDLLVYSLELSSNLNVQALAPSLLRALQEYGAHLPAIRSDLAPFREISFLLGRAHPLYEGLGRALAPVAEPPYAWYVRVPDVARFIQQIAPILERRLAHSSLVGFTGDLKLTFYQHGLRIRFEQGLLTLVEPWRAPAYQANPDAGCPPSVFTQLLLGYRDLDELRAVFPDVWANPQAEIVLRVLFPARPSWVIAL